ncbi:PspC domain-containing protein [Lysobacter fragariae]
MNWNLNELRRSRRDRLIGGVCGGLGRCTPWASWVWRALFLAALCFNGTGAIVYLILWVVVQEGETGPQVL